MTRDFLFRPKSDWVLILLIFALVRPVLAGPTLEEVVEQKYAVAANATLTVHNTDGAIFIYGAEPGEVKIFARKKAYSKARLDGIQIKVTQENNSIAIETLYPPRPEGLSLADRSGTVDYIMLVPETTTVARAELDNGEIILEDLRGDGANARLTNGRIILRDCFCPVRLAVDAGALDIFYNWWEASRIELSAVIAHGHLRVLVPPHADLQIDAASKDGKVTNGLAADPKKSSPTLKTTIGHDTAAAGLFQLRASSGNIRIEKGY